MKTALGKGLNALIPASNKQEVLEIELSRVVTGPSQPRKVFNQEALAELASSIKEKGVIQPILVKRDKGGTFVIIAGERRYRASEMAGLKKMPAIVREASEEEMAELALIENLQREDLNPMETATAFEKLQKQFGLTQEQVSDKVGKQRATVANYLRLLNLPDEIKKLINESKLSMGHARAILGIADKDAQIKAARQIVSDGMSVRSAEVLGKEKSKKKAATPPAPRDPNVVSLEEKLIKSLGTKVKLVDKDNKGSITIEYYSLDELDRLLDILL